eukprot:gene1310-2527_t
MLLSTLTMALCHPVSLEFGFQLSKSSSRRILSQMCSLQILRSWTARGKKIMKQDGIEPWLSWSVVIFISIVIFISFKYSIGKIFYHLAHARSAANIKFITLIRVEQLAPFPYDLIEPALQKYPNAELVWVQEEPKNMGAWSYVKPRFDTAMRDLRAQHSGLQTHIDNPSQVVSDNREFTYIGRKPSASAATGSYKVHVAEMKEIIDKALMLSSTNKSDMVMD